MALVIPSNLGGKRRKIAQELDMLYEDENGNYIITEFTEEQEAEWAKLDELTEKAKSQRLG
jgi:hypothetical protein